MDPWAREVLRPLRGKPTGREAGRCGQGSSRGEKGSADQLPPRPRPHCADGTCLGSRGGPGRGGDGREAVRAAHAWPRHLVSARVAEGSPRRARLCASNGSRCFVSLKSPTSRRGALDTQVVSPLEATERSVVGIWSQSCWKGKGPLLSAALEGGPRTGQLAGAPRTAVTGSVPS